MEKQINLSDSEWKLMNRLWERSPMTIMELTAAAREETGWTKNTVITMLSRLEAKGAVRRGTGPSAITPSWRKRTRPGRRRRASWVRSTAEAWG